MILSPFIYSPSNKIFSYLIEEKKFDMFKYSKKYQNILDIRLIDYKIFYGKYIIFEDEGKGKEYNVFNDKLIFEGEYSNGKRNGKGKEYYKRGILKFEGEYSNGKKWNGKGYNINNEIIYEIKEGRGLIEEYNNNGKLIFEGEYLKGKQWNGKGKEYNFFGNLLFEGEYINGEKLIKN